MNRPKAYYLLPLLTAITLTLSSACSHSGHITSAEPTPMQQADADALEADSVSQWLAIIDSMPAPDMRLASKRLTPLAEIFNDSNYLHLEAARAIGIEPISDTHSHFHPGKPLEKIATCADFYVDPLTYSEPYLVPQAAAMLHDVGRRFSDIVRQRGQGGEYRIRVTSILRTPQSIARLRRVNPNAIDSSVHQMATTVDISYVRFAPTPGTPHTYSSDDLRGILAEVLYDMRSEGRCLVKYEVKQACFHITAVK